VERVKEGVRSIVARWAVRGRTMGRLLVADSARRWWRRLVVGDPGETKEAHMWGRIEGGPGMGTGHYGAGGWGRPGEQCNFLLIQKYSMVSIDSIKR
jgi:hypothetical protein